MNRWDAAYSALAPFFFASAGWKMWRHGKYRRSLPGMWGKNLPEPPLAAHQHRAWLHSVSVGETVAAGALYRVLRERHGDWQFLSTTTTETGQDQARRSLPEADFHDFVPLDFSWKVRRFLEAYHPSLYLFFETEIWPNILLECGRRKLPIFLVNGKLSERSGSRYLKARRLIAGPLSQVRAFLMQTEDDAERMRRIVGPNAQIHVTGNIKFDSLPKPISIDERKEFRTRWGVESNDFVLLAGSTHPNEEMLIWKAFQELRKDRPELRLVIAPRHPERFKEVAQDLAKTGAKVRRSSEGGEGAPDVTVLDEMGVLARAFGAADIALVGGAWNPIGGHNLLEPAAHGIPVVHGPHMHAQKEIMRIMRRHRCSVEAQEARIAEVLGNLISNQQQRDELGRLGQEAALENAGAAKRSAEIIEECLASISGD